MNIVMLGNAFFSFFVQRDSCFLEAFLYAFSKTINHKDHQDPAPRTKDKIRFQHTMSNKQCIIELTAATV